MKILVVDDHPLIVRALAESLPHVDPRFDVIASANREQTLYDLDLFAVLLDADRCARRRLWSFCN